MTKSVIGSEEELFGDTDKIITEVDGLEIAIFKMDDGYYALPNHCVHQNGPCGEGRITGTIEASFDRDNLELTKEYTKEGEIINCPWHSWEYEIKTGDCLSRQGISLPTYDVEINDGNVTVEM
jgi:nitrite reductase/ring-hydroxylating ferredoxin subunit